MWKQGTHYWRIRHIHMSHERFIACERFCLRSLFRVDCDFPFTIQIKPSRRTETLRHFCRMTDLVRSKNVEFVWEVNVNGDNIVCVMEYNLLFWNFVTQLNIFSMHRIIYRFIYLLHNSKTTPTVYWDVTWHVLCQSELWSFTDIFKFQQKQKSNYNAVKSRNSAGSLLWHNVIMFSHSLMMS